MQLRFEKKVYDDWHHVQTIEVTPEDEKRLLSFMLRKPQIKGFYRYRLGSYPAYETIITFLLDYLNDMKL